MCTGRSNVLSAGMSGITFGLLIFGIDGIAHGHSRALILGELGVALLLGTLFIWRQTRLADPMMPIDVFKRRCSRSRSARRPALSPRRARLRQPAVLLPYRAGQERHRHRHPAHRLAVGAGRHRADRRAAGRSHHAASWAPSALTSMTLGLVLTALLPPNRRRPNIMWRWCCAAPASASSPPQQPADDEFRAARQDGSAGGIIASARTLGQTVGSALVALYSACSTSPARRRRGHGRQGGAVAGRGLRRDRPRGRQPAHAPASASGRDLPPRRDRHAA